MKVYVAGPMTGIAQFNYPAFIEATKSLRSRDFEVVSPAELDDPEAQALALASPCGCISELDQKGFQYGKFLARDIEIILDDGIEAVVVLPGWEKSRGARLETFTASAIKGLPVLRYSPGHMDILPRGELFAAWLGTPGVGGQKRG